jgi:hypothetical protein
MRNAWSGLRDRLGFRPSSPTTTPVSPAAVSPPPPDPEPAPSASPVTPVDPRTQLLADMARAFQMGMGLEDGSGSGSRSGEPSSPAIEVNLGDGQQRQQQEQRERSPPPEDSFERFLMDLQVDLRRTLEEGQPEAESEPEQEQEVEPVSEDLPPLIYPQEAPLSTHDRPSADEDLDFGESLPALPPDDDDLPPHHQPDDIGDDRQLDGDIAVSDSSPAPSQPPSQTPMRRTVAGSERRPGGGINWWRMYRFPPMVVAHGTPSPGSSPASPLPPPPPPLATAPPALVEPGAPSGGERGSTPPTVDTTQMNAQDGNTVVPVIVVGLQSVHGYGHTHGHRHTDGRDEHPPPPLPPPPPPPPAPPAMQQQRDAGQDSDQAQQDDNPTEAAPDSPHNRERRWSSRAADALRGLRPVTGPGSGSGSTRREASSSSGTEGPIRGNDDGHGSTTFFIYVIGGKNPTHSYDWAVCALLRFSLTDCHLHRRLGYYPPNHQLVTGTDPLDSFEELAELLGHAKPQTASKEDIDNSGLEVIRLSSLAEYEKLGRVAPMCVDRVRAFLCFDATGC